MSRIDTTPQPAARQQPADAARRPDRWIILGAICAAQLVVLLDNTVLNLAIPELNRNLGAGTADVQWMINAYALVQSGLLLAAGSLADRYGRKLALITGLLLFGLGSLAAAFSSSPGQLIAARAGMGVGGALLMTTTLAVIMNTFDAEERPKAIGIWGAVSSAGFAAGPVIGGVLLSHFWWGSVFLINVPVAAISAIAVIRLIPETRNPAGDPPDVLGALLSILGMVGLVYPIISGPQHGWTSAQVLVPLVIGLVGLAAFGWWETRAEFPMLDLRLFRNEQFNGAIAGGLLVAFGMAGSLFLLTQQLQLVLGYSPLAAGLRTVPLALTIVGLNLGGVSAKLLPRIGTAATIGVGMTSLAAGLALVAVLGRPGHSYLGVLVGLLVMGAGIALAMPAMANAIMGGIPVEKAGVGAGVQGTITELGGGLGVAVLGAVLSARFAASLPAGLGSDAAGSLTAALAAAGGPGQLAAVHSAFATALRTSQVVGAGTVFAGGMLAAVLLRRAMQRAELRR